jgi:RNA 3'-terminal phosphate cyclase-like protein
MQFMALGPEDVCKVYLIIFNIQFVQILFFTSAHLVVIKVRFGGSLSDQAIDVLRVIKEAFGITFKIKEDRESKSIYLSCLGSGYLNISRKVK